jgi:hypothetical protein
VSASSLAALYLAAGAACAALAYRAATGPRWRRAAATVPVLLFWPLWAPFVLLR